MIGSLAAGVAGLLGLMNKFWVSDFRAPITRASIGHLTGSNNTPCHPPNGRVFKFDIDEFEMTYTLYWKGILGDCKGQPCRIVCRGKLNNVLVAFEDGFRVITSRYAVRKAPEWAVPVAGYVGKGRSK